MKEKQLLLGTRVFPIAWKWWNSPACNALIHLARLIDNPDSFADNLMTSILRLKFNNLAPFEKHVCDVMIQGMSGDAWNEFFKTTGVF